MDHGKTALTASESPRCCRASLVAKAKAYRCQIDGSGKKEARGVAPSTPRTLNASRLTVTTPTLTAGPY